jgi:hypothetical protein
MTRRGAVYIAENAELGFCKVGSTVNPIQRAQEVLDRHDAKFRFLIAVEPDYQSLEKLVHLTLAAHRVEVDPSGIECYALTVPDISAVICRVAMEHNFTIGPWEGRNIWLDTNLEPPRGKLRPTMHVGKKRAAQMLGVDLPDLENLIKGGEIALLKGQPWFVTTKSIDLYLSCRGRPPKGALGRIGGGGQ